MKDVVGCYPLSFIFLACCSSPEKNKRRSSAALVAFFMLGFLLLNPQQCKQATFNHFTFQNILSPATKDERLIMFVHVCVCLSVPFLFFFFYFSYVHWTNFKGDIWKCTFIAVVYLDSPVGRQVSGAPKNLFTSESIKKLKNKVNPIAISLYVLLRGTSWCHHTSSA